VQQHNWVLVDGGEAEAQAVADAGLTAGLEADYLPADKANVLANTDVLDGGGTDDVTFTAPAAPRPRPAPTSISAPSPATTRSCRAP
jgi:azurin